LSKFIDLLPESLPSLVAAGSAALDAYAQFLTDCVELAESHCRISRTRSEKPSQFLSWQLHNPLRDSINGAEKSWPKWIDEVRSLRGAVLFDNGRRPNFKIGDGCYTDPDPIDLHAWHILAYAGDRLVGCVRVYPLTGGGPPCLTEMLLGEKRFSQMLRGMGKHRDNTIEIGRWVVDPALRISRSLAPGIAAQLAAGAGALAFALVDKSEFVDGVAIFSAGSQDKQDLMLSRLGLRPVLGIEPVPSAEYDDVIRVMYCTNAQQLQSRFRRIMDVMAETIGLDQTIPAPAIHFDKS
jgi:hypothetical protein